MKTWRAVAKLSACLTALFSVTGQADGGSFKVIHSFNYVPTYGAVSNTGDLVTDGERLYGSATFGGDFGRGEVYAINLYDNSFERLHSFFDNGLNGSQGYDPQGGLLLRDSTLYGAARVGTVFGGGAWFRVDTDGGNFGLVTPFSERSDSSFGRLPNGNMLIGPSGYLIGTLAAGGTNGRGVLRGIPNAPNFSSDFSLPAGAGGAIGPSAGLATNGSTYFGTANLGGASNLGAVFSINNDGSNYHIIHSFAGGLDGSRPDTKLTVVGSMVFGMAGGTIFAFNTDGTGYHVLRTGAGNSGLTLVDGKLFGVDSNRLWSINLDGTGYKTVSADAPFHLSPVGGLTQVDDWLYGVSRLGGDYDRGMVYAVRVPEPSSFVLAALGLIGLVFWHRRRKR